MVDVDDEVRRGANLRHRAGLFRDGAELQLGQVAGVMLLLAGAEQAVVAQAHRHHSGVEREGRLSMALVGARVMAPPAPSYMP